MKLKYCETCKENSIAVTSRIRQRDGVGTVFERCLNKNPKCGYKNYYTPIQEIPHGLDAEEETQVNATHLKDSSPERIPSKFGPGMQEDSQYSFDFS